jgi:hypothetical protein
MLVTWAGTLPDVDANLFLGVVFMLAVLAVPQGLLPAATTALTRLVRRTGG